MGDDNIELFYRLRSLDRLLGAGWQDNDCKSGELAKQEIYFASPSELNDPMEGFSNIVFKGDKIVWHNFFKHYLICLERICSIYIFAEIFNQRLEFNLDNMPIYNAFDNFPTQIHKKIFDDIYKDFILECNKAIDAISTRTTEITTNELNCYLTIIHRIALTFILEHYVKNNLIKNDGKNYLNEIKQLPQAIINIANSIEQFICNGNNMANEMVSKFCLVSKNFTDSLFLENNFGNINKNKKAIICNFPNLYLQHIQKLIYPEFYVACFLKEAYNSSIWGHYADGHKGVCLIFKTLENKIKLVDFNRQTISMQFQKIDYNAEFENINFFENLSRLTLPQLLRWYQNENGEKSPIISKIFANENKWREEYWKKAEKRLLSKTKDWKYEKEYRLTINSFLKDKRDRQERIFQYNFNDLNGIIFGINTPQNAKDKIIDIVRQKCKDNNRQEFNLYQAYYCDRNKNIQYMPLPKFILELETSTNNQNIINKDD